MTETQAPATQAELDEMTYSTYLDCGQNSAETARQMGISASTVTARVKRHAHRSTQDELAEIAGNASGEGQETAAIALVTATVTALQDGGDAAELAAKAFRESERVAYCALCAVAGSDGAGVALHEAVADWLAGTAGPEQPAAEAGEPAGLPNEQNPGDSLAYRIACRNEGCGAAPMEPCVSPDREGTLVIQPWPHPVRVDDAKAQAAEAAQEEGIDFSEWTDAQLQAAAGIKKVQASSNFPALQAELGKRAPVLPADGAGPEDAAPGPGKDAHGQEGEPAPDAQPSPGADEKERVAECVNCGFKFTRPQVRKTCQSEKACKRRQEAKAGAAG